MANNLRARLLAVGRSNRPVRFTRPFEDGYVHGYVLDVGPRWFALGLISDGIRLDGYQCFRVADVRDLRAPHPHAHFLEAVLISIVNWPHAAAKPGALARAALR